MLLRIRLSCEPRLAATMRRFASNSCVKSKRPSNALSETCAGASGQRGTVTFDGRLDYESFRLAADEPSVRAAAAAIRDCGLNPELTVTNGGLDANWMNQHGIPTATLGCGQVNQHMTSEALHLPDFHSACQIAWRLATTSEDQ